jgi:transaldolase
MVEQGKWLASLASNIVVKIPVENEFGVPCLGVINQLEKSGIKVNATAILSFGQLVLAAKTGATYVSLFAGKIANEGGNYGEVIAESVNWLEYWNFKSQLIVGSIQSAGDFIRAAQVGAHIITVAPQHLMKMADHKYSRNIVYQFMNDAQNSLKMNMKP